MDCFSHEPLVTEADFNQKKEIDVSHLSESEVDAKVQELVEAGKTMERSAESTSPYVLPSIID